MAVARGSASFERGVSRRSSGAPGVPAPPSSAFFPNEIHGSGLRRPAAAPLPSSCAVRFLAARAVVVLPRAVGPEGGWEAMGFPLADEMGFPFAGEMADESLDELAVWFRCWPVQFGRSKKRTRRGDE